MRKLCSVLLFTLLLTGCAKGPETLRATGAVLEQVGRDWLAVNAVLVAGCRPSAPTLDQPTCLKARNLGIKMKTAYPLAMNRYEAGVNANDANIAGGAKAAIRSLAVEGAALAVTVGLQFVTVD